MGDVVRVEYDGAPAARPAPGVRESITGTDLVVVCPSNPVTSVGPILAVPGIAEALAATRAPVVGVSPIIGGAPVSGPAGRLMQARGLEVSPLGVAAAYAPWLRALLIDDQDRGLARALAARGVRAVVTDVMMPDHARERALARRVLDVV
jgi:LPPG:FO 2-phospho-L-lactate transferase